MQPIASTVLTPSPEFTAPAPDCAPLSERAFALRPWAGPAGGRGGRSEPLFGLAAALGEGESLWLEAACLPDAARSVALRAGAVLAGAEEARLGEVRQALEMCFPGVEIESAGAAEAAGGAAVLPLRGVAVRTADLGGAVDPDLAQVAPRARDERGAVVLGTCAAPDALAEALATLRRAGAPMALRLVLAPRLLTSREVRELAQLYKALVGLRGPQLLTSGEVARLSDTTALVGHWLAAKAGVAMRAELRSEAPVPGVLAEALVSVLSVPPSARGGGAGATVDLAGCFVRGQRWPSLALEETRFLVAPPSVDRAGAATVIGRAAGGRAVVLDDRARSRHLVVCGSTGTGKSTLVRSMIADDIARGRGVVLIDPHGDLFGEVRDLLNRQPDVPAWIADTGDLEHPYSLNLFQSAGDAFRRNFVCNQLIRLLKTSLYKDVPQGFGPMWEAYFRNAFLLLADADGGATIADMDRVFGEASFRRELYGSCTTPSVSRFWRNIATRAGGEAALENIAPYIVSKLTQFVGNPVIAPIVCARESTLDFGRILGSGGVCLVNLAKGRIGATEAEILGGVVTTALFAAALERSALPPAARRPVRVYLDEFQSYAGEVIAEMLAECRKYGLELTLATQSLGRLQRMNGDLAQSVLGNAGNIVALRSGPQDAHLLAAWIGGGVTPDDITGLDDFHGIGRFLAGQRVTPPLAFRLGAEPAQARVAEVPF